MPDQVSMESRYYILSLEGNAKLVLRAARGHWGIQNGLHWVLDIAFREDESRVRKDHGPESLGMSSGILPSTYSSRKGH